MEDEDFETLTRLCLTSDNMLIGCENYKQKLGFVMSNNLAPSLAIIYINELDSLITSRVEYWVILKRYIGDYFALLFSSNLST